MRTIAHVDMDAFYASIEVRDDPSLTGRPVVVGGPSAGRGVVAAASYPARVYGIHSAMPMARAERLCRDLVIVPPNFSKYQFVSRQVMEILGRFSPKLEPLSLDEAFLDLTGTERVLGSPSAIGPRIKEEIRARTRLTASVGIAPVKFVAKIASDLEKPDGLVIVAPGQVEAFLRPLPIARLWGVGPKTRDALEHLGIRTIGHLADADSRLLASRFGEHGRHLSDLARGVDEREVIPDWDAKSYSHEETFSRDREDPEFLEGVLLDQALRVSRRLRGDKVSGRVVQLKLRYHDFRTVTRRRTLSGPTADADRIYRTVRALFRESWTGEAVRLIGAGVSGVDPEGSETLDLFAPPGNEDRRRQLADAVDRIENRFGRGRLTRARLIPGDPAAGHSDGSDEGSETPPVEPAPGAGRPHRMRDARLVSESLEPISGSFDPAGMSEGAPGLPAGFRWKGRERRIASCLRRWGKLGPEPGGELYRRRHYFEILLEDGERWTVYCLRHVSRRQAKRRWFLYSRQFS